MCEKSREKRKSGRDGCSHKVGKIVIDGFSLWYWSGWLAEKMLCFQVYRKVLPLSQSTSSKWELIHESENPLPLAAITSQEVLFLLYLEPYRKGSSANYSSWLFLSSTD